MNFLIHGTLLYLTLTCLVGASNVEKRSGCRGNTRSNSKKDDWKWNLDNDERWSRSKFDDYSEEGSYSRENQWRNQRKKYYIPSGLDTENPIDEANCLSKEIRKDPELSSPVECARTCHSGQKPKTCYYNFVLERYPISGLPCQLCTPNMTNQFCPTCQCIPADGVERMALSANRMLPGPVIEVCENDQIVVDVTNKIKGDAVSIHWHGVFQKGYQYYDGVPFVTQCPITEGSTFRYNFLAGNGGTHFWHSHSSLQKMDGLFGGLIIRKPIEKEVNTHLYDYDISSTVIIINDWMHEQSTSRFPGRNSGIVGQLPDVILINGKGRYRPLNGTATNTSLEVITVEANRRYRFRLVNSFCSVCPGQITIQDHKLTAIETDGEAFQPVQVDSIISFAGERYDFVINANQRPGAYWIQVRGLTACSGGRVQQVAILQYKGASTVPNIPEPTYNEGLPRGVVLNPIDGNCKISRPDAICIDALKSAIPIDPRIFKAEPDVKLFLPVRNLGFGVGNLGQLFQPNTYEKFLIPVPNRTSLALIDGISFHFPPSPPLSQIKDLPSNQFCNGDNLPKGCRGNCTCTHVIPLPYQALVEVVLVDEFQAPGILHPFHLHGHSYRVMCMGQPFSPVTTSNNSSQNKVDVNYVKNMDKHKKINRTFDMPPAKDTLAIPNNGFVVLRFIADNPGYWLFHCHFVYHQMIGMDLLFWVGSRKDLPPVPQGFPKCGDYLPPIHKKDSYR